MAQLVRLTYRTDRSHDVLRGSPSIPDNCFDSLLLAGPFEAQFDAFLLHFSDKIIIIERGMKS